MTATPVRTRQHLRPGAVVRCRTRRYLVEDVQAPQEPGADTIVSMACMEDDAIGARLTVFREREVDFELLGESRWDAVAQRGFDLVFHPTEERRRSGSHYTPRSLTQPIVAEALRPWQSRMQEHPTARQILDLKICDPAMGSGAFLVESCRYLAELLEAASNREGLPEALRPGGSASGEEPLIYARRLIAQRCLYGVDKNPFAVNLARLSLWLVSLSKDAPSPLWTTPCSAAIRWWG